MGKGRKDRFLNHYRYPNNIKKNPAFRKAIIKLKEIGIKPEIIFIARKLTEKKAFYLEKKCIKLIGKKCDKQGPLYNLTEGGEGHTKKPSKEWIEWLANYNKTIGRWCGKNNPSKKRSCKKENNGFWGKHHSKKTIKLFKKYNTGRPNIMKGKKIPEERRIRIVKALTGRISNNRKNWLLIDFFGNKIKTYGLSNFCKGKSLIFRYLRDVAKGRRNNHKGIVCYDLTKISEKKALMDYSNRKLKRIQSKYVL